MLGSGPLQTLSGYPHHNMMIKLFDIFPTFDVNGHHHIRLLLSPGRSKSDTRPWAWLDTLLNEGTATFTVVSAWGTSPQITCNAFVRTLAIPLTPEDLENLDDPELRATVYDRLTEMARVLYYKKVDRPLEADTADGLLSPELTRMPDYSNTECYKQMSGGV